jgi:ATP-binding protein involved in chromosome partitioning
MEPRTSVIEKRLENINRIIAVASGKGGVGKSLISSVTALALVKKGFKVGLLDLDLYGPSSHIILGVNISNIILELLAITRWDDLDFLIIDMPPGIGDEVLDVINLIPRCEYLVVSTPSKVAMGAVDKLIRILNEIQVPVLGVIENMKMRNSLYVQSNVMKQDTNFLGSIGFDEHLEDSVGNPIKLINTKFSKDLQQILKKIVKNFF